MKKIAIIVMVFSIAITSYSQKKKTGTAYSEHPAIVVVEAMQQAFVAGDVDKVASYLSDDFKSYNGSSTNPNAQGRTKEQYLERVTFWKENISYLSIERAKNVVPDAIEYKDNDEGLWVFTWDEMKGVHTETGSKINMPVHNEYLVGNDNKIKVMFTYSNDEVFSDIGRAFNVRKNGTVYDQHANINKVKLGFAAFENGDYEKALSLFAEDATFRGPDHLPGDKSNTFEEFKAGNEAFLSVYTITAIDMTGYPDYLHYERGNIHLVQSWWNFRLVRKSDQKKFVLPAFYTHEFNDEGKIEHVNSYINLKLLDDKDE